MKLFPHYQHTVGVFSLSELPKKHNSRTQIYFSIKRILLNVSVSWKLNYSYERGGGGGGETESPAKQPTTDMKTSTVILSNKKAMKKLNEGILRMFSTFWEKE